MAMVMWMAVSYRRAHSPGQLAWLRVGSVTRRSLYIRQTNQVISRNGFGRRDSTINVVEALLLFFTPGSKDPRGYKLKKLKSKCRMVIGPASQLAECRAKARS